MANKNLHKAKNAKNDEFYTQLTDIEKELKHYKEQLKGKVIFLNCDDHKWSNFYRYFEMNFKHLGIKKLIATHYNTETMAYKIEVTLNEDDTLNVVQTDIGGNGDFRSPQSIGLLKEADIVITNPPFSLFREYVAQVIKYNKKYILLGNNNAITYKEIFPLFKQNKMWMGTISNKTLEFEVPMNYPRGEVRGDKKFGNVPAISWFTNLDITKRNENIIMYKKYNKEEYQTYDNYDAINVDKVADIPEDYFGTMGVPITFMGKHNPEQFEILGLMANTTVDENNMGYPFVNGKKKYARVVIRRKENK